MKIKVRDVRRFIIRDRETGTEITRNHTIQGAKEIIEDFEMQDKLEGVFEENFYEIYDSVKEEIVHE